MSGGVRLGAFGWATHTPHSPNRKSKRRAFVAIMENGGRFAVLFGRSEPRPGQRFEVVSDQSNLGRRMGLRVPTFFTSEVALLPADYDVYGFFAIELNDTHEHDVVAEYDLWLKLKVLAEPPKGQ